MTIYRFFDKLEDKIRHWMSHRPILYGFIGGAGIVLFWRGVWYTADLLYMLAWSWPQGLNALDLYTLLDGPLSILAGAVMLLLTGIFVSSFIGNEIIITGLKGERKTYEKTELEVKTEAIATVQAQKKLREVDHHLETIEKKLGGKK